MEQDYPTGKDGELHDMMIEAGGPPKQEIVSGGLLSVIERAARDPNVDIDKMERLFQMQERVQERQDNADFNEALRCAQAEMPAIFKANKNETTRSTYTQLEDLNAAVNPVMTRHGFSFSFGTAVSHLDGHYRVICDLSRGPVTRQYFADVPIDNTGMKGTKNKTDTHGFGSAMSYGRRYLKLMIADISTTDDDGNRANAVQAVSLKQYNELQELLQTAKADEEGFKKFFGINDIDDLPAARYAEAKQLLNQKMKKEAK